jgi:hypothetical protein
MKTRYLLALIALTIMMITPSVLAQEEPAVEEEELLTEEVADLKKFSIDASAGFMLASWNEGSALFDENGRLGSIWWTYNDEHFSDYSEYAYSSALSSSRSGIPFGGKITIDYLNFFGGADFYFGQISESISQNQQLRYLWVNSDSQTRTWQTTEEVDSSFMEAEFYFGYRYKQFGVFVGMLQMDYQLNNPQADFKDFSASLAFGAGVTAKFDVAESMFVEGKVALYSNMSYEEPTDALTLGPTDSRFKSATKFEIGLGYKLPKNSYVMAQFRSSSWQDGASGLSLSQQVNDPVGNETITYSLSGIKSDLVYNGITVRVGIVF